MRDKALILDTPMHEWEKPPFEKWEASPLIAILVGALIWAAVIVVGSKTNAAMAIIILGMVTMLSAFPLMFIESRSKEKWVSEWFDADTAPHVYGPQYEYYLKRASEASGMRYLGWTTAASEVKEKVDAWIKEYDPSYTRGRKMSGHSDAIKDVMHSWVTMESDGYGRFRITTELRPGLI